MNGIVVKGAKRCDILELWWLKARRAASGQNAAAVRYSRRDEHYTVANIFLPMIVFALGICNSLRAHLQPLIWMDFTDIITIATGLVLCVSYLQFVGDFRAKALGHRQASTEFSALAQTIELTGFELEDDVAFSEISSTIERIQRTARHVPERDWAPARDRFAAAITEAEERVRARRLSQP